MVERGETVIGITVGNYQARAAVYENGQARLIPLEEGELAMPSAVLLHRLREVGKYAYLYSGTDPNLLVTSINRLIGRHYREITGELQNLAITINNESDKVRIADWLGAHYSPIELYAMVLRKLQNLSGRYLGALPKSAVIAVPGSFDDYQRRSVRVAAETVFQQVKLINEPTAALLALRDQRDLSRGDYLLTVDIGAGKCEVAILQRTREDRLRINAICGDTRLGGDDLDYLIFNQISDQFFSKHGERMIGDSEMARHEVLMAVRAAKHQLAQRQQAEISVPFVNFDRYGRPLHLNATITREELIKLSLPLLKRVSELIRRCHEDAGYPALKRVILLGGSTRLPFIAWFIEKLANSPQWTTRNLRKFIKDLDQAEGVDQTAMASPDELAALGASLYGAQLSGRWQGPEIEDVTAHSLGITTYQGGMGFVLRRQSNIPSIKTENFVTVEEDQRDVHIEVREGEGVRAAENRIIGEFWLPLPPRLPRRSPINVTIGKDEDGIVLVRAFDPAAGTTREITITYDL